MDNAYTAGADLFTDSLASDKRGFMCARELIDLRYRISSLCGMDRFRSGLNNKEFAAHSVFSPFDIHRLRMSRVFGIMLFN